MGLFLVVPSANLVVQRKCGNFLKYPVLQSSFMISCQLLSIFKSGVLIHAAPPGPHLLTHFASFHFPSLSHMRPPHLGEGRFCRRLLLRPSCVPSSVTPLSLLSCACPAPRFQLLLLNQERFAHLTLPIRTHRHRTASKRELSGPCQRCPAQRPGPSTSHRWRATTLVFAHITNICLTFIFVY